jgi:hypothetical protein
MPNSSFPADPSGHQNQTPGQQLPSSTIPPATHPVETPAQRAQRLAQYPQDVRDKALQQPDAFPTGLPPAPRKGVFGFLSAFFMLTFGLSVICFIVSFFVLANLDYESYSYEEDTALANLLMGGGALGAIMSGIGWGIASLGERLALRGII